MRRHAPFPVFSRDPDSVHSVSLSCTEGTAVSSWSGGAHASGSKGTGRSSAIRVADAARLNDHGRVLREFLWLGRRGGL